MADPSSAQGQNFGPHTVYVCPCACSIMCVWGCLCNYYTPHPLLLLIILSHFNHAHSIFVLSGGGWGGGVWILPWLWTTPLQLLTNLQVLFLYFLHLPSSFLFFISSSTFIMWVVCMMQKPCLCSLQAKELRNVTGAAPTLLINFFLLTVISSCHSMHHFSLSFLLVISG